MPKFVIQGGKKLSGTVRVSGSKNAALPLICATLLTDRQCVLTNVPEIADVKLLIDGLRSLGAEAKLEKGTLTIQTQKIKTSKVPAEFACKMRASILLAGPLLARLGKFELPTPGGCVIGRRPTVAHEYAFERLGAKNLSNEKALKFAAEEITAAAFNLPEMSVTATENAIMAAALTAKETKIRMAAYEPHVVDLCHFLEKMGVKIEGIGTHTLKIRGKKRLAGATHPVTTDYLEVGTFAIAGLLTGGTVRVEGVVPKQLDSFFQKLSEIGANYFVGPDYLEVQPTKKLRPAKIQTAVFPGFPTDLQAPMGVLLAKATGQSQIFETLFEGRLGYLGELEKMGAKVEILNPHQARVHGPAKLRGAAVTSWDLRAGAAVVLAALAAKGESEVFDIQYIDRGYENFDEKLRQLGAKIERVES